MLICMLDEFKKRDDNTVDIPGALLQTKILKGEEDVYIILDGRIAGLLTILAPETYQEYVHQAPR